MTAGDVPFPAGTPASDAEDIPFAPEAILPRPLTAAELESVTRADKRERGLKSVLPREGAGGKTETESLPFAVLATKLENVPAEPSWVWNGYLAPGAVTLLAGRPKVGKSTLGFGLLAALARGDSFLDRKTSKHGVLLLSEEREGTLAEKARIWKTDGSIHLLMRHEGHGVDWPEIVDQAADYCRVHRLGVLVVDTFDKWTGLKGDAENLAGSVREALDPLLQAASTGLAVLVIAHQRKSLGEFGEAVRGSNALTGGVDVVVEIERPRSEALDGKGTRVLYALSRYQSTPEELVLELTDEGYETRGDTLAAQADAERAQVLETIETLGRASLTQMRDETGLGRTSLQRHLTRLQEEGHISKSGAGKRGDPFVFCPSAHGLTGQQPFWEETE